MAREAWQEELKNCITSVSELAEHFPVDQDSLKAVADRYPFRVTPYYFSLIKEIGDPVWKQCVPDVQELEEDGFDDPLAEESMAPVPAIVHRYPDRVIFLVSGSCAGYCRFCTRKRKVGCSRMSISFRELREGIDYIAATPEIRDVIFSGGDPLVLPDSVLDDLLARVYAIPHVEMIRIGTRVPVTLPQRVTGDLCRILKKYPPLYLNTHFNHPMELTEQAAAACSRLADAGIMLGNQTVLLRGVNDSPKIITDLFRGLLKMRVRPYYLHHMDLTRGTGHFRTPVASGLEIVKSLRGPVSGLASPHYVIDLPGGRGKVPLIPEYVRKEGSDLLIKTPEGELIRYPDIGQES